MHLRDSRRPALQSHDLLGEGMNFGSHRLFWPHKDVKCFPGWGISWTPGPPPRQHEYERRYTPGTHWFILTRWIWKDDYDGQMIFGDFVGLKLPCIYLTGEENPGKNLIQETCPDRGSNPGPLRDRRAWYRVLHSDGPLAIIIIKNHFIRAPMTFDVDEP